MGFNQRFWISCQLLLVLLMGLSAFAIPDSAFASQAHIGRNLLQAKKGCPVNFEFLNYTIITSQCKGPRYPPKICCAAFKEFACPYADVLNDLTNECATTMFSYINIYGKYPPGLFASECREGKEGLACPALPPSMSASDTANQIMHYPSMMLMLSTGFLFLLFL
ncbi:GPI-anchored protein LLG1-like [Prosopis cineraria]|uniref:GPI-anchored protein LLG1-like n=1 Tax=Prosopis cineraria TaxID=364024 RepID=UPI00240EB7AE|nr:GPI-anchored protein LLG1-like [Prosopis cineraria]XP_054798349.1 GPI-anchored protein LLG1-like [Prosopis cineraria]